MKKILTLIVDGIGLSENVDGNAFKIAKTPTFDRLFEEYPNTTLIASGSEVGLSEGQSCNSLIGFETLTAGQKIKQKSSYAHDFVDFDNLAINPSLKDTIDHIKKHNSTLHVMGMMSDGGIESNIQDTISLLNYLKTANINIVVDFITDGKTVESKSAIKYINMIEATNVQIASICGRYYAMDNNQKWDRTKVYYDLIRKGEGLKVKEINLALKNCYMRNITDEFIPPIIIKENCYIKDNDAIIWMNYEGDSSRQILDALTNPLDIDAFETKYVSNLKCLMLYPVDSKINGVVLINEEEDLSNSLGSYFSKLDLTQARISDVENEEFVTYYFNGKTRRKLPKCNSYIVDFPKDTPDIDKVKAVGITKQVIKAMERDTDFILANLGQVDKFGHTGDYPATVNMMEFIDECLSRIIASADMNFYKVILLSTHGNVENMIDDEGKTLTI